MDVNTPLAEIGLLPPTATKKLALIGIKTVVQLVQRMLDDVDGVTKVAGLSEQQGWDLLDALIEQLPKKVRRVVFSSDPDVMLLPAPALIDVRLQRGQSLRPTWGNQDLRAVRAAVRIRALEIDTTQPAQYVGHPYGRAVYRLRVHVGDAAVLAKLRSANNVRHVAIQAPERPSPSLE